MWLFLYFSLHISFAEEFDFFLYSGQVISGQIIHASDQCTLIKSSNSYKAVYRNSIQKIHVGTDGIKSSKAVTDTHQLTQRIFVDQQYQIVPPPFTSQIAYSSILSSAIPYVISKDPQKARTYFIFELSVGTLSYILLQYSQKGAFISGLLSLVALRYWVGQTTYKKYTHLQKQYESSTSMFQNFCRTNSYEE